MFRSACCLFFLLLFLPRVILLFKCEVVQQPTIRYSKTDQMVRFKISFMWNMNLKKKEKETFKSKEFLESCLCRAFFIKQKNFSSDFSDFLFMIDKIGGMDQHVVRSYMDHIANLKY